MKYDIFKDAEIDEIENAQNTIDKYYKKAVEIFINEYADQLENERLCDIFNLTETAEESASELTTSIFLGGEPATEIHEHMERIVNCTLDRFFETLEQRYNNHSK